MDDPLLRVAEKYFLRVKGEPKPGDLLLFRMRPGMAVKHCAIVSGPGLMIHAYTNHEVREDEFTDWWRRKKVGAFKFKGVR